MRAAVRSIYLEPDPRALPEDPAEFHFLARLYIGPSDGPGEEILDMEVCSPEWLSARCAAEGFVLARRNVVTTVDAYSEQGLRSFLIRRVESATGDTWRDVTEKLAQLGYWTFEFYSE